MFPRSKKVWVFGIPDRFAWNSKYVFLHVAKEHKEEVKAIWISRNRRIVRELRAQGFPAYFWFSLQGFWYPLRAKFFIYDASIETISYWLSGGAKKVLLWHGIPLKKIEQDVQKGESMRVRLFTSKGFLGLLFWFFLPWRFLKPDYAIATSEEFRKIFSSAFRVPEERISVVGFPKNDIYFKDMSGAGVGADLKAIEEMKEFRKQGKRVILYAPTWRDTAGRVFLGEESEQEKLNLFLQERNAVWFSKMHVLAKAAIPQRKRYDALRFVDSDSDADLLLNHTDVLVTDYSGIFFEFLLLDRPMAFFPYDYEKYVSKDRELYFDYNEATPGPKAYAPEELFAALEEVLEKDNYQAERRRVRDMTYARPDGGASERTYQAIRSLDAS
ncbi:CDP-glycerol glycerophosphotransferase family protein [Patescibacteria group bacterium]|nr:CDP-glycerol glycerophosphotransferase family protein [Patescibacteria group bacterium]